MAVMIMVARITDSTIQLIFLRTPLPLVITVWFRLLFPFSFFTVFFGNAASICSKFSQEWKQFGSSPGYLGCFCGGCSNTVGWISVDRDKLGSRFTWWNPSRVSFLELIVVLTWNVICSCQNGFFQWSDTLWSRLWQQQCQLINFLVRINQIQLP